MGSMTSKHHYDVEPNVGGGGELGSTSTKGSTWRRLTLMDNLSLIAALEIYGVESITHLHTDHALENIEGGINRRGAMSDPQ